MPELQKNLNFMIKSAQSLFIISTWKNLKFIFNLVKFWHLILIAIEKKIIFSNSVKIRLSNPADEMPLVTMGLPEMVCEREWEACW